MAHHQHINASGFPLQLALAQVVKDKLQDWKVLYQEHAWRHSSADSGFIDLAIEWKHRTWVVNIECKRVRDTEWIFLRDATSTNPRKHAKLWVTYFQANEHCSHFDWADVPMDPASVESNMCVVPGQDSKSMPMLERIANSVVLSTEALATEEAQLLSNTYSGLRMYQNVIVTTAKLCVCDIDLSKINLSTGEIDANSAVTEVPYVRFRKQVGSTKGESTKSYDIYGLRESIDSRESTVFIVNSDHFAEFINACEVDSRSLQRVCGR